MGKTADSSLSVRRIPAPAFVGNRTRRPADSARTGHLAAAVLVLVWFLAPLVGLASVAYLTFAPVALLVTAWLLWERRWHAFLVLTTWMWLLTPFLRRVIEWKAGYHESSLILIPPAVAGLMAIPVALRHRRRVDRTIGVVFLIALVTFGYGALVGLVRNGPTGAAVDVLAVLGPFGAGLFALLVPEDPRQLRRILVPLATYAVLITGAYGILQFFVVPAWDAQWMIDSGVSTTGKPLPGLIRVFSTLNISTPFAEVVAAFTLVAMAQRQLFLRGAVLVVGLLSMGLSLVRAAWLATSVAAVGLLNNGRLKARTLLLVLVAGVAALVVIGGPVAQTVYHRYNKTVSSGSNDTSFKARLSFQESIAGETLANPVGRGMGSTGTALKLGATGDIDQHFTYFDSGVFENATTYGSVLGLVLVIALFVANVAAWRRSRGAEPVVAYCASAVTMLMVSMLLTNTVKNAPGFVLWLLLAVAARAGSPRRTPAPRATSSALRVPATREERQPALAAGAVGATGTAATD